MKIRIEVDETIESEEIVIRCREFNEEMRNIQQTVANLLKQKNSLVFYKNNRECYITLEEIVFFETDDLGVNAHTLDQVYQVKYKLYELEELLPSYFVRVAKSTIVNIESIYSITRNLTSSSLIEFKNTHKKVYVSRHYFKQLKNKLTEKRI